MERDHKPVSRRNQTVQRKSRQVYMEGNTARRLQEIPEVRKNPKPPVKRNSSSAKSKVPVQRPYAGGAKERREARERARKHKQRTLHMNAGFVVFLIVISVAILYSGLGYLQLRAELTSITRENSSLERELSQLREENSAYYNYVTSQVDFGEIKKIAIGRLGMKYPTEEQTMTYETSGGSFLKQYHDVPTVK